MQFKTKYDYVENENFKQYWNEFGLKHPANKQITENSPVKAPISSKSKTNNNFTVEKWIDMLGRYIKGN